jgi:hypothetical protein
MSPAVSTALPDFVMTLARKARFMPAIPMAERSPPMVVGMRHTKREMKAAMVIGVLAKSAKGLRVTVTMMNTKVKPANKDGEGNLIGGFCRLAPSTKAIILSRKLSPGSW